MEQTGPGGEQKPTIRLEVQTLPLQLIGMDDAELDRAIAAARAAVNAPRLLERLEAEQQQRQEAAKAKAAECAALLDQLTQQLADREAHHRADLEALERTPRAQVAPVVERAYVSGRLAYSLAHDLFGITGDRRFYRPYAVPDQLALCGGAAGEAYVRSIRGRPPRLETPWRDDVTRLRELWGPRPTPIGNGG